MTMARSRKRQRHRKSHEPILNEQTQVGEVPRKKKRPNKRERQRLRAERGIREEDKYLSRSTEVVKSNRNPAWARDKKPEVEKEPFFPCEDPMFLAFQLAILDRQLTSLILDTVRPFEQEYAKYHGMEPEGYAKNATTILDYISSEKTLMGAKKAELLLDLKLWGALLEDVGRLNNEPQYSDPEGMIEDFKTEIESMTGKIERQISALCGAQDK